MEELRGKLSLSPPRNPSIGDIWVDPFTAERFIFTGNTGERPDEAFDGWELWALANERYEYLRAESEK